MKELKGFDLALFVNQLDNEFNNVVVDNYDTIKSKFTPIDTSPNADDIVMRNNIDIETNLGLSTWGVEITWNVDYSELRNRVNNLHPEWKNYSGKTIDLILQEVENVPISRFIRFEQ